MSLQLKLIGAVLSGSTLFAALLLIPAQTLVWWPAWILVVANGLATGLMGRWLLSHDPDLLVERLKPALQPGQPVEDKVAISLAVALFVAWFAFIPFDVFYWHVLPIPRTLIRLFGLLIVAGSLAWMFLPLRENRYLTTAVRHQAERGHHVIDTGVYAIVRHPMYAGFIPYLVGSALWLGSYTALPLATIPIAGMVARLLIEESYLFTQLNGYSEYAKRVPWRLVPGLW